MDRTIKKFDMKQPMHTVKMKCNPDEYHRQGENKPYRVIFKGDQLNKTIGHGPEHQHFIRGLDQHPTHQRIKHIVQKLIV